MGLEREGGGEQGEELGSVRFMLGVLDRRECGGPTLPIDRRVVGPVSGIDPRM